MPSPLLRSPLPIIAKCQSRSQGDDYDYGRELPKSARAVSVIRRR